MKKLTFLILILFVGSTAHAAPIPSVGGYSGFGDSPLNGITFDNYFYLEDFESYLGKANPWNPGEVSTPGVTGGNGGPVSYTFGASIHDSVDEDDGSIDGSGLDGESWFYNSGAGGVSFTFDATILGSLPTHVGLVWTDGAQNVTVNFEAFDGSGVSLGSISLAGVGDAVVNGTTAEDTFFGWEDMGGIGSIAMSHNSGGIEVDHLQYGSLSNGGGAPVPEPSIIALFAAGLFCLGLARRRKT